jgi:hypothetical protein
MSELDDYHRHEALHVISVVRNLIANELEDHPYIEAHPDLMRAIGAAQEALGEAYQSIGERHFGAERRRSGDGGGQG